MLLRNDSVGQPPATGGARLRSTSLVSWLAWCLAAGAALACLADAVAPRFSPLFLFPLLLGMALGAALVAGMRRCQLAHGPALTAGSLLAGLVLAAGQHYLSYREARWPGPAREAELARAREIFPELAPPKTFGEFMRRQAVQGRPLAGWIVRGPALWGWWGLDAALPLAAALGIVAWRWRQPYCGRCQSWYGTVRCGRLSRHGQETVAAACGLPEPAAGRSIGFRLLSCRRGCGPWCLELSWNGGRGAAARAWLNPDTRNRVTAILDREAAASGDPA